MPKGFIPDNLDDQAEPNRLGYRALKSPQAFAEDGLAGYTTKQTEKQLKAEIWELLSSAGASGISIDSGKLPGIDRPVFCLGFTFEGIEREIIQVCLPTRTKTDRALKQSRCQSLYNLRDSIRMELERRHYQPFTPAFAAYMLMPGEDKTLGEIIVDDAVPLLIGELVEG